LFPFETWFKMNSTAREATVGSESVQILLEGRRMAQLIHRHSTHVRTPQGVAYRAEIWADRQRDGTWAGWIEFAPIHANAPVLRTERETTQPNRRAVEYWASGIEPVYLWGAFERAQIARVNNGHRRLVRREQSRGSFNPVFIR
jgi:hypothetical protein